jgi:hypothetical protein
VRDRRTPLIVVRVEVGLFGFESDPIAGLFQHLAHERDEGVLVGAVVGLTAAELLPEFFALLAVRRIANEDRNLLVAELQNARGAHDALLQTDGTVHNFQHLVPARHASVRIRLCAFFLQCLLPVVAERPHGGLWAFPRLSTFEHNVVTLPGQRQITVDENRGTYPRHHDLPVVEVEEDVAGLIVGDDEAVQPVITIVEELYRSALHFVHSLVWLFHDRRALAI